jgi:hypothetical protein
MKFIGWILLFSTMFGYRILLDYEWRIKRSDPTLWVKFCDNIYSQTFTISDLPDNDPLRDAGSVAVSDVLQSIIDDYNNVTASYLRLAIYPADPDSPGAPLPGDSTFTRDAAKYRTIDVCIASDDNPFRGGHASLDYENGYVTGCNIVLIDTVEDEVDKFISTLTHELGHCVGFDHPQETRHSIMSYYHDEEDIRLQIVDKMGLLHLYPASGYDLEERANFGLSCGFKE